MEMARFLLHLSLVLLLTTFSSGTENATNGIVLVEDAEQGQGSNPAVVALFVFGDSVLDAGTNSLFPSLLRADFEPYGTEYFGKPTGRFTNGRTYADFVEMWPHSNSLEVNAVDVEQRFEQLEGVVDKEDSDWEPGTEEDRSRRDFQQMLSFNGRWLGKVAFGDGSQYDQTIFPATYIGLPLVEPYLKRKDKRSLITGVNYASAGSGLLLTSNAENVIPFPDQILQFGQTKLQIEQTFKGKETAKELFSKSLFLINIGANDIFGYIFNQSVPQDVFIGGLLVILKASVEVLYEAGARKVVFLGTGPLGCVPGALAAAGVTDGQCVASWNDIARAYNTALEQFVYSLHETFPDIKAIIGKPYDKTNDLLINGPKYGFTAGVTACCGSGIYNAAVQCGRPADIITNPPTNLCDDVDKHVFWDFYHPTDKAYGLVAKEFWSGNSTYVAPVNLETLVSA